MRWTIEWCEVNDMVPVNRRETYEAETLKDAHTKWRKDNPDHTGVVQFTTTMGVVGSYTSPVIVGGTQEVTYDQDGIVAGVGDGDRMQHDGHEQPADRGNGEG